MPSPTPQANFPSSTGTEAHGQSSRSVAHYGPVHDRWDNPRLSAPTTARSATSRNSYGTAVRSYSKPDNDNDQGCTAAIQHSVDKDPIHKESRRQSRGVDASGSSCSYAVRALYRTALMIAARTIRPETCQGRVKPEPIDTGAETKQYMYRDTEIDDGRPANPKKAQRHPCRK